MSNRLNSLLSSEEMAREKVEEATREARRIRTGIPAEVSKIENEYSSELQKYERNGMGKVNDELVLLEEKQKINLEKRKKDLDSMSGNIVPRAIELIRSAIEKEKR
ncbi:MAG: hypothetical protein U9P42_04475 [Candidatus Fermentibacteria bacterium]|nr:hypothetical protein [Candidatus Fermentibacteria bacterium]